MNIDLGKLGAERSMHAERQLLTLAHGCGQFGSQGVAKPRGQSLHPVTGFDGPLDVAHRQVRKVAFAFLPGPAEVVGVARPVATCGLGVDQARRATGGSAAFAEQATLEIVIQQPVADTPLGPQLDDVLHAIEEGLRDDRLVEAADELPVDGHPAGVIGIGEHFAQAGLRDRLRQWPAGVRPRCQAKITNGLAQLLDGILTGGVQLPGVTDQRGSLWIEPDAVEQPPFVGRSDVEVAEGCAADGAAAERLVAQLRLNVLAALPALQLIEDVRDTFHRLGDVPLAEVLAARDDSHTEQAQAASGDCRVDSVSEGPGAHVDDDVVDVVVLLDVGQQLAEHRALLNAQGRVARFDELALDSCTQSFGFH